MPVPLPPAKEAKLDDDPNILGAYNVCLALEKKAETDESRMHVRILGYLILHAPSSTALAEIVRVIQTCAQDEKKLLELGECFRERFIRPFKVPKGRTPASSDHSSRLSLDRAREDLTATIKEPPNDHRQAKTQALIRDGYRCAVTGIYDAMAINAGVVAYSGYRVYTELAHILPRSTYFDVSNIGTDSPEEEHAALILAVLQRFGYDVEKVHGPKVHSLYNVITMQHDVHDAFDRLEMWFETTVVPNCYRVESIHPIYGTPDNVTFISPDPLNLPYPSQQYLALHATCAKIAHLSGAREYIDKFDRDADELDVLETDGSSSAVLIHAILKSASLPVGSR